MPQSPPTRQSAPAETLIPLNEGLNLYTDPTQTKYSMWAAARNCFSGTFGYVQRARFANIITSATPGYNPQFANSSFNIFRSSYFLALPGLSNYLLADVGSTANAGAQLYSFDSATNYAATLRINPYVPTTGVTGTSPLLVGPWSRQMLQNIVYEMNGQIKQSGRLANAATIEGWGLDTPDTSPQVAISAGNSIAIVSLQRLNGTVTAVLAGAPTADMAVGNMINVDTGALDPSFVGTFVVVTNDGVSVLTWAQVGQTATTSGGNVTTQITKSVGRSYSWAWENANKFHIGAPSPSTQYIDYQAQEGLVELIEVGTIATTTGIPVITGTGTQFTDAWVGRSIWMNGHGAIGKILSVTTPTGLTIDTPPAFTDAAEVFQVYDPQSTNVRLYETADGGANYFRTQRNAFVPSATTLAAAGLSFLDTGNSEPPDFPFTTELSQLYNIPPPVGAFVQEYQGSLLVYGVEGAPQSFFYSNQTLTQFGQPQESFAPLNQVTLPIQNAVLNGMVELPGVLVMWSDKQDMFTLNGTLTDNTSATSTQQGSTIAALPYNLGCASPFAVALTPLGAIWVTSNAEVWLFTGRYAPRNIGRPIQALLQSISPTNLNLCRMQYYHTHNRNWIALSIPANGASENNTTLMLDLDMLASNGSPSFFVFDMATAQPTWFIMNGESASIAVMYEKSGLVRLIAGGTNNAYDMDFQGGFGAEIAVTGSLGLHAWGNDSAFIIKRPNWFRFNTNQDPSQLAPQGWQFTAGGIDDDFYTFFNPLILTMTPGVNDTSSLCGNPNQSGGSPFRHSPELFKVGGVNFTMGRRIQFGVTFPSAPGANYQLRSIQMGFGPSPPR